MRKNSFFALLSFSSAFFLLPLLAWAQPVPDLSYFGNFFQQLLNLVNNYLIPAVFGLALIFFFWGMATFILSAGNEEKRATGKQKMFWGIIILTVMVGIWGIVAVLLATFGIPSNGLP